MLQTTAPAAWQRRAKVNVGLIVTLVVVALIAGGYWIFKGSDKPDFKVDPNAPEPTYTITCEECKTTWEIPRSKFKEANRDDDGNFFCEKCQAYTGHYQRQGGASVITP
jgi:hypothetical protein